MLIRELARTAKAALTAGRDDRPRYRGYPDDARFINIGAGDFSHPRWTNVDHASKWYSHAQRARFVEHDLMREAPLPFADRAVALAYTSHTIEHVTDAAVATLFAQVHRVLAPGGLFRVVCPDADLLYTATKTGRRDYWRWRDDWFRRHGAAHETLEIEEFLIREVATERSRFSPPLPGAVKLSAEEVRARLATGQKEAVLDWLTGGCSFREDFAGNHINWWNYDKCAGLLRTAGFATVWRSAKGASLAAPLQNTRYFDTTAPVMSLYLEAMKE